MADWTFGHSAATTLELAVIALYTNAMKITLPLEQEQWLEARIADGLFASPEEAVRQLIAERMALERDDFAWAKPYADEARAAASRGEVASVDEAVADIDAHLASLKR